MKLIKSIINFFRNSIIIKQEVRINQRVYVNDKEITDPKEKEKYLRILDNKVKDRESAMQYMFDDAKSFFK